MTVSRIRGCGTALVTPFTREGAVDERALRALVEFQLAEGIDFLVPCGSTGEAATLSPAEHRRIVEITVEVVRGRVPVMAGAGSNNTARAVELSREMQRAGATHLLHVSPMYNKPPQRGIVAHFRAVAEATSLPIVVYNVPGRTSSNIEPATAIELAAIPNIVGIKEASGRLEQIVTVLRDRPARFSVLSGDDALTIEVIRAGGDGVISVVSNVVPGQMTALVRSALDGRWDKAQAIHDRLMPWMEAAFVESNPIPVKAALAMLGKAEGWVRLPLVPLDLAHYDQVRASLVHAGALTS